MLVASGSTVVSSKFWSFVAGIAFAVVLAAGAVTGTASGHFAPTPGSVSPVATSEAAPEPAAATDTAAELAMLDALPIKGPRTQNRLRPCTVRLGVDGRPDRGRRTPGCDIRNDVLRRDLVDVELKPGTNDCVVLSGILNDPYTGSSIAFQRGRDTSRAVQIDHVVALSDAWQKGAQQWDEATRRNFVNDPLNLQATSGPINEHKGDGDAATWLPPNKSYRCGYAGRIVEAKSRYGLWVTQGEHEVIARILTAGYAAG